MSDALWHKYPQEKPDKSDRYLIWRKNSYTYEVALYNKTNEQWWLNGIYAINNDDILAWMLSPIKPPFVEEKQRK